MRSILQLTWRPYPPISKNDGGRMPTRLVLCVADRDCVVSIDHVSWNLNTVVLKSCMSKDWTSNALVHTHCHQSLPHSTCQILSMRFEVHCFAVQSLHALCPALSLVLAAPLFSCSALRLAVCLFRSRLLPACSLTLTPS